MGAVANKEKTQANESNKQATALVKIKREKENKTWGEIAQELDLKALVTLASLRAPHTRGL